MIFDTFNRPIDCLRVSVTDRCNLRCYYCAPQFSPDKKLLELDDLFKIIQEAVALGISKIKLTGGEPLVRPGVSNLVAKIRSLSGVDDISMTSNGVFLERYAKELKEAGLDRINISLDTLDPLRFKEFTGGDIEKVLKGIFAAQKIGIDPIKLNCVVKLSSEEEDAKQVAHFAKEHGFQARFIRQMNLEKGEFWGVEGGTSGRCESCRRLRLTSDGKIWPCLFNELFFDTQTIGIEEALMMAIHQKPLSGKTNRNKHFYSIGG